MRKHLLLKLLLIWGLVLILFFTSQIGCYACTLWAAAGDSVVHGGTLIAKNRDWEPLGHLQLKLVQFNKGHRFLGLYDGSTAEGCLKAGVNEYGLVVVNAVAPNANLSHRTLPMDLLERLLSQCKTIQEVFRNGDWFRGSRFLLVADKTAIMSVEIGPGGMFVMKKVISGTLCHTNHFIRPEFKTFNSYPLNESSLARLFFIQNYLSSQKRFGLDDFVRISLSEHGGPDNSLWRRGKTPVSTRTTATFIVYQPIWGKTILFIRLANPGQPIKTYYLDPQELFHKYKLNPSLNYSERKIL